jgi:hypothetical protein
LANFQAHRQDDPRVCGATTIVTGQNFVFVNGKLWAVENDAETHGGGTLIPSHSGICINGVRVVVNAPDTATLDNAGHNPPLTNTADGSPNVFAYK